MARCRAAARRPGSISAGPPSGAAFRPAWAASSTTPPTRMARSGVRWKTSTPWLASRTAGTPGTTAARMPAMAWSEPRPVAGHRHRPLVAPLPLRVGGCAQDDLGGPPEEFRVVLRGLVQAVAVTPGQPPERREDDPH